MKKIMKYTLSLLAGLFLLLASCVETYEAKIDDAGEGCLVIEGNIISDSTVTFYLSRTFGLNESYPPTGYNQVEAEVAVVGSDGSRWNGVGVGDGAYQVRIGTLSESAEYSLEVVYQDETYTSDPQKPLRSTPISDVRFQQEREGNGHYSNPLPVEIYLSTEGSDPDASEYYFWNYIEDWEVRAPYYCRYVYDPKGDSVAVYDEPPYAQGWMHSESYSILIGTTEANSVNRIDDKLMYSIGTASVRISFYYSTLLVQRNMSKGEYEYYQARKKYSEDMGGLFTPQPSELPTNIKCSNSKRVVVGYVGCNMNVSTRRLNIPTEAVDYTLTLDCKDVPWEKSDLYMYNEGYQIKDRLPSGAYVWGRLECSDVRVWGANVDKNARPSWWPEDLD